jgi:hypothetical protein
VRTESPSEYTSLPWPHELPLVLRAQGHQEVEGPNALRTGRPEVAAATRVTRTRVLEAAVGPREDKAARLAPRDPVVRNDRVRNDRVLGRVAGQSAAVDLIPNRGRAPRGALRLAIRGSDLVRALDRVPGPARPLQVPVTKAVAAAVAAVVAAVVPAPAVRPVSRVLGRNAMIVPRIAVQGPLVIPGRGVQPTGPADLRPNGIPAPSGTPSSERDGGVWPGGARAR